MLSAIELEVIDDFNLLMVFAFLVAVLLFTVVKLFFLDDHHRLLCLLLFLPFVVLLILRDPLLALVRADLHTRGALGDFIHGGRPLFLFNHIDGDDA